MICPECNKKMDSEDLRADTDRGVFGDIVYWCDDCGYEVTGDE